MAKQPDSGKPETDIKLPDPAAWARNWARITEQSQKLMAEMATRQQAEPKQPPQGSRGAPLHAPANPDPLNVGGAFMEIAQHLMADPAKLAEAQMKLWQDYAKLWANTTDRFLGREVAPLVEPDKGDKRFKDAGWQEGPVFDFLKQSYLLTSR